MTVAQLHTLIQACQKLSGSKQRLAAFRRLGANIKPLIAIIYDPYRKFHVTSKAVLKYQREHRIDPPLAREVPTSLLSLLTRLTEKTVSGHAALREVVFFLQTHPETQHDTILRAVDKDLKIRVGTRMVNKAFPCLVPVFACALSYPWEKHQAFYRDQGDKWFVSRKLDGCRCLFRCTAETKQVQAFSRSGHSYPRHIEGLDVFFRAFEGLDGVLDGEMLVLDAQGQEHFNVVNAVMNPKATPVQGKKNVQLQAGQYLCFFAFDWIPTSVFDRGQGGPTWSQRQRHLQDILPVGTQIRLLEQVPHPEMPRMWREVERHGWEGLILRLDCPYEGKKSRKMLKRKTQADDEFAIVDASASTQLVPGSAESAQALEHVAIMYKDQRVWVGGGFSWAQRLKYGQNPEILIGKHVTVKHYGETTDREGRHSLRHPSVKTLWLQPRAH